MTAALTITAWLRYELIRRLIPRDASSVLEIGVGRGALGRLLARRHQTYVGVEIDPTSFEIAAPGIEKSGGGLVRTVDELGDGSAFDVVCAFEVLEHIEDDRAQLATWIRHARPGGSVVLSVPAHPERFGPADVRAGHHRRYSRQGLERLLGDAGLEGAVVWAYGWPITYVLERAKKPLAARDDLSHLPLEERTHESGRYLQPPDWLAAATMAAAAPFRLVQLPFRDGDLGTGWVARATRPRTART